MTAQNSAVFQSTFMSNKSDKIDPYAPKWGYDSVFIVEGATITHVMGHGTHKFFVAMTFVTSTQTIYQCVDQNNQVVTVRLEAVDPYNANSTNYYILLDYSKAKNKRLRPKKKYTYSKFWVHRD